MKRYNVANRDESGYYSSGFDTWHEANELLSLAKAHDPYAHIVEREVMTEVERLQAELEAVKRERDALMFDFKGYVLKPRKVCRLCKNRNKPICNMCDGCDVFEWRGLCAENGGVKE